MTPPLTALAALLDKEATSEEVAFADGLTSGNPNRWTDADLRVGRFIASIRVKSARQALELAAKIICPWCRPDGYQLVVWQDADGDWMANHQLDGEHIADCYAEDIHVALAEAGKDKT